MYVCIIFIYRPVESCLRLICLEKKGGKYSAKNGKMAYNQLIMTIVKTLILLRH